MDTDPNVLVMPADGVISQLGKIEEDKILQAKGHNYSLEALLAGNYLMADLFRNGTFVTTYLSPRDYHRVHMPCNGILREMIYVPGNLSSLTISPLRTCRICFPVTNTSFAFSIPIGPMAQILVERRLLAAFRRSRQAPLRRRAKVS
ncbi:archaetidylserine decarboxylase [Escherichia coli]